MTAHTMDHDDLRHAAALLDQVEETLAHAHGRVPPVRGRRPSCFDARGPPNARRRSGRVGGAGSLVPARDDQGEAPDDADAPFHDTGDDALGDDDGDDLALDRTTSDELEAG